jgi:hypothetical protein
MDIALIVAVCTWRVTWPLWRAGAGIDTVRSLLALAWAAQGRRAGGRAAGAAGLTPASAAVLKGGAGHARAL